MTFLSSLSMALRALGAHKLRSLLTTLGIILGVSSVIIMVAIGAGAQASIQHDIRALGANVMVLVSGSATTSGARLGSGSRPTVTERDALAIAAEVPAVAAAAPVVRGSAQIIAGNANWATNVVGTSADFFVVRDWNVTSGRVLEDEDVQAARKTVVLGQTVAEKLFPYEDPVGEVIRVDQVPFTVIGVLASKGQTTNGTDQDDHVFMPLDSARNRVLGRNPMNPRAVTGVVIKVQDGADMSEAAEQIRQAVRQQHGLPADAEDDFLLSNLTEMMQAKLGASRVMALLLAAIASISLLVGGIGIMNIMLVSVTERTREIGIRMAVGAQRRHILLQFLIEAVVLCMIGGVIGTLFGIGGSAVVSTVSDLPALVETSDIILALGVAAAVGVLFGYFPAQRAALFHPIDALRYE
jgi:putative ABC transport system permease protein